VLSLKEEYIRQTNSSQNLKTRKEGDRRKRGKRKKRGKRRKRGKEEKRGWGGK
jgi:hypothetical protein